MDTNKSAFVERCLACEADAVGTVAAYGSEKELEKLLTQQQ
ncbi:MAG TPA: hypothetical protein VK673_17505 [Chthoniobacterales bacterium]|nr:hypothetical protein [Chthoniobacterales bacterium]